MPELEKFESWVVESAWADEDLETQVQAYLGTFPGRVIPLVEELVTAAQDAKERKNGAE